MFDRFSIDFLELLAVIKCFSNHIIVSFRDPGGFRKLRISVLPILVPLRLHGAELWPKNILEEFCFLCTVYVYTGVDGNAYDIICYTFFLRIVFAFYTVLFPNASYANFGKFYTAFSDRICVDVGSFRCRL